MLDNDLAPLDREEISDYQGQQGIRVRPAISDGQVRQAIRVRLVVKDHPEISD